MEIDRNKIRFKGIGLCEPSNRLWPRDILDPEDEFRKIISLDQKYMDISQLDNIRDSIMEAFEGLRRVNMMSLLYKYCPLDGGHFHKKPFSISAALDTYTSHEQVIALIHQTLRAINWNKYRGYSLISFLFGSNHNFDIFREHIKWLVTANRQCRIVHIDSFISTQGMAMDIEKISWLQQFDLSVRIRVFSRFIFALVRYTMEIMRRLFYITKSNPFYERLFYYRFDLWQKIQSKKISDLVSQQVLEKITSIDQLELPPTMISKMKFYPKVDDIRLICTKARRKINHFQQVQQLKIILNYVLENTKNYSKFTLDNLLISLRNIKAIAKAQNSKLFIVKTDIKDCFQSINQDLVREIVKKSLKQHMSGDEIKLHKFHCRKIDRQSRSGKEFVRWSLDPNLQNTKQIQYFKSPDTLYMSIEDEFDREYLRPNLINPLLKISKNSNNAYILLKGLEQGSPFSPILCSIYIQEAFNQYVEDFITSKSCELFCFVDDILFLSTNEEEARNFMHRMLRGFKDFNLRMNMNKMKCNFECHSLNDNLMVNDRYVVFYKQRIDLNEFECSYDYNYLPVELQDTFRVSSYFSPLDIRQLVSKFKISLIHLDCQLNRVESVVTNIFEKFLLFAHRIATLLLTSVVTRRDQNPSLIQSLVELVVVKVNAAIKSGTRRKLITCSLSEVEISLIGIVAFSTTWNLNKLRHRKLERLALDDLADSCYRKLKVESKKLGCGIVTNRINLLFTTFPSSSFHSKVILPSKKATRRQRRQ